MATSVLHSGALGYRDKPRWVVLQSDRLLFYASFLEASFGTKPQTTIRLAEVLSVEVIEEGLVQGLLLRLQRTTRAESLKLAALEEGDDLHTWQHKIQRASEAVIRRSFWDQRASEDSLAKISVKSGRLSILLGSENADEASGQAEDTESQPKLTLWGSPSTAVPGNVAESAEKDEEIQQLRQKLRDTQVHARRLHEANLEVMRAVLAKVEEMTEQIMSLWRLVQKNGVGVDMVVRQRQLAEELLGMLQSAQAEQEAALRAAHKAEVGFRLEHQAEQEGDTSLGQGSGAGRVLLPMMEAEGDGESSHLNWDLPAQFRRQLGPNLRLPLADERRLVENPIYHGTLGMLRDGEFEARYCMLYVGSMKCFKEPADILKGLQPSLVFEMHQIHVIEIEKASLGIFLQFLDGTDAAFSARSMEAFRGWYKVLLAELNRRRGKESVVIAKSPRHPAREKILFITRAGTNDSRQDASAQKDRQEEVGSVAAVDKPGIAQKTPAVADRPAGPAEAGRGASPPASARKAGGIGHGISRGGGAVPTREGHQRLWSKGQRKQRPLSVDGDRQEAPFSDKSRARTTSSKIMAKGRATSRAPSSEIPNNAGDIVL